MCYSAALGPPANMDCYWFPCNALSLTPATPPCSVPYVCPQLCMRLPRAQEQQVREELKDKQRWLDQKKKNICLLLASIEDLKNKISTADADALRKDRHIEDQKEALAREQSRLRELDEDLRSQRIKVDQCMAQCTVL